MDVRVYEDTGGDMGMLKGNISKCWKFSNNGFWNNIGYIIPYPTSIIGGSRLFDQYY